MQTSRHEISLESKNQETESKIFLKQSFIKKLIF